MPHLVGIVSSREVFLIKNVFVERLKQKQMDPAAFFAKFEFLLCLTPKLVSNMFFYAGVSFTHVFSGKTSNGIMFAKPIVFDYGVDEIGRELVMWRDLNEKKRLGY